MELEAELGWCGRGIDCWQYLGHQRVGGWHRRVQPCRLIDGGGIRLAISPGIDQAVLASGFSATAILVGYGLIHGGFPQPSSLAL